MEPEAVLKPQWTYTQAIAYIMKELECSKAQAHFMLQAFKNAHPEYCSKGKGGRC